MGEIRKRGEIYWIRYYRNGVRQEESTESGNKQVAIDLLRVREGRIARGENVNARMQRFRFDEAAADVLIDYRVNEQSSIDDVEGKITNHLMPYFGGRRMVTIGTADVKAYIAHRQTQVPYTITLKPFTYTRDNGRVVHVKARTRTIAHVSNAEINRELGILKRAFNLAVENEKIAHVPYIPMLQERNVRKGFFEFDQFVAVGGHLPDAIRDVVEFGYITGWRIDSEVLPLQWSNVDFAAGVVTIDPEMAKNDEPRTFPMTDDLRALLDRRHAEHVALRRAGHICPFVFFRMVAKGRRGPKAPKRIKSFRKAWVTARRLAACPGRVPHDFRRTAVRSMVRRFVPDKISMALTGHKTRSVFDRYNVVSEGDLRLAAERLAGLTGTKKGQFAENG